MNNLIPQEIKEQIPKLYDTEDQSDPVVCQAIYRWMDLVHN